MTTVRMDAGRQFGLVTVAGVAQISQVNGVPWDVQSGPGRIQGDSVFIQLGVSVRVEARVGSAKIGAYADVTATRVPLLMQRSWYEEDVATFWGEESSVHEDEGEAFKHAGLGLGVNLSLPLGDTGLAADISAGPAIITGIGWAIQTQAGLGARF